MDRGSTLPCCQDTRFRTELVLCRTSWPLSGIELHYYPSGVQIVLSPVVFTAYVYHCAVVLVCSDVAMDDEMRGTCKVCMLRACVHCLECMGTACRSATMEEIYRLNSFDL